MTRTRRSVGSSGTTETTDNPKLLPILWTERAQSNLRDIGDHVANDNPEAAWRLVDSLMQALTASSSHPLIGRIVPEFGQRNIREIIYKNYRLVYRADDEAVTVLAVFEGHRLLANALKQNH